MLWELSLSPVDVTWLNYNIPALDCSNIILSLQYRDCMTVMVTWLLIPLRKRTMMCCSYCLVSYTFTGGALN
jgi:hypothetical protein